MKRIYKYPLQTIGISDVQMPGGGTAKMLYVGEQDNVLYVWAEVDTDFDLQEVKIEVIGTGWDIDDTLRRDYISTVQMRNGLVWHIYRVHDIEF